MFNKYRELGLSLIPVISGQKRPVESEWSRFCERLPTEEEAERWDSQGHQSFGLALGPAGGVLAVDIDSDDAKVLNAVKTSPLRKRGKKGETRFFRFHPDVPSTKVAGCIDILGHGRQTVMPPSMHPDGFRYQWLTPDTFEDFQVKDLPLFTIDDLSDLRRALEPERFEAGESASAELTGGPWTNSDPTRKSPTGSHDRLKRIANAMISRGASPDEAVRELIRFDNENHFPSGYFSDGTRTDCFADPVSNALFFYASNLRTFNRRQFKSGHGSVVPLVSGSEMLEIGSAPPVASDRWVQMQLPEPSGLVKDVMDLVLTSSKRRQPAIALGCAVSVCSVLIANRFKLGRIWPNVYSLIVAETGSGKGFAMEAAQRLLAIDRETGLLGNGSPLSLQAFLKGLIAKRERLDLIDECSDLFNLINTGGSFQANILDSMNALWSASRSMFMMPSTKDGTDDAGRVYNPCVSIMMATNQDGFATSVTRTFITKGFIPRCLMFVDWNYEEMNDRMVWDEGLYAKVDGVIESLLRTELLVDQDPRKKRNLLNPRPSPEEAKASERATVLLEEFEDEIDREMSAPDTGETRRQVLSRLYENTLKLALIHGIMRAGSIDEEDAVWAIATARALVHNAAPLLDRISARTPTEAAVIGIEHIIQKKGIISRAELFSKTRHLSKNMRNEALEALTAEGKIKLSSDNGAHQYTYLK